jgi:chorismate dehydratase
VSDERRPAATDNSTPVRVGHIEFLNCYPLYFGLTSRAAQGLGDQAGFELVPGVPTDLNRMLLAGTIDFGPISSIEYARGHRQLILSRRLSISAKGAVDSIHLVSRGPIKEVRRVALTPQSATSVVLLKTILRLRYGQDVEYRELREPAGEALDRGDSVLLIGDQGLEALYFPLPGTRTYDLGQAWEEWTGLPMVYAVWAARRDYADRNLDELRAVEEELVLSNRHSRDRLGEVVEAAAAGSRFDGTSLGRYFSMLYYGFGTEYEAGLRRFYELAHEAGELPEVPELGFFDGEGS